MLRSNVEGNGIRDASAAQQLVQQIQFNGTVRRLVLSLLHPHLVPLHTLRATVSSEA